MRIKKEVITKFLEKVKMSDSMAIGECILKFAEDGLHIVTTTPSKLGRVEGWLPKASFKEYVAIDSIGVNDFNMLIKVMQRFGEEIVMSKEGNLLTIKSEGKSVDVELISENFLTTDSGVPKLNFTEVFTMTGKQLKGVYDDVSINKDATLNIVTKEKSVDFKNTGKYKFTTTIKADMCKGGVSSTFGAALIDATKQLDGDLEIAMAQDYPIKITEKTKESIIVIIVAPRVEEA